VTTFEKYLIVATKRFDESKGEERVGQAYFNALDEHFPKLAKRIRGSNDDPFYDDAILPQFLTRVEAALRIVGMFHNHPVA
jgi:hypothetical protein